MDSFNNSVGLVTSNLCLSATTQCSIETTEWIKLIVGTQACFNLTYIFKNLYFSSYSADLSYTVRYVNIYAKYLFSSEHAHAYLIFTNYE